MWAALIKDLLASPECIAVAAGLYCGGGIAFQCRPIFSRWPHARSPLMSALAFGCIASFWALLDRDNDVHTPFFWIVAAIFSLTAPMIYTAALKFFEARMAPK